MLYKILTEPQPKKAKLLCCVRKAKHGKQGFKQYLSESSFLVPSETPAELKFLQSHSLKRLSCSVAPGRPNCITECWTCTIINVSFRNSFVCKIKGWSSPSSLNNTKMHSRKFLTIIPSIIDHKL